MTKPEYFKELNGYLGKLPPHEVREIMADYEEHFAAGRAAGKTDAQIIQNLGSAKTVSQEILVNSLVSKADSSTTVQQKTTVLLRMLATFMILAPLNFFMIIGPFLLLVALLICGWTLPLVGGVVALVLIAMLVYGLSLVPLLTLASLIFMFTGTLGLVVMVGVVMLFLTRGVLSLLVSYLKWNINFINARKA